MTKLGGARPGAGAKKGSKHAKTIEKEELKKYWRELAFKSMREVFEAHVKNAIEGDMDAIKEYYNRQMGKVTEEIDHTSGGKPIFLPSQLMDKYKLDDTDKRTGPDSK